MERRTKSRVIGNMLISVAISLIANFSYLLLLFEDQPGDHMRHWERHNQVAALRLSETGVLRIQPDGYGYVVYPVGSQIDSVYLNSYRIFRFGLEEGDSLQVSAIRPRSARAHYTMHELISRNGQPFDYSTLYDRPDETAEIFLQILCYGVLAMVLITILTAKLPRRRRGTAYVRRYLLCALITVGFYLLLPALDLAPHIPRGAIDMFSMLKCSFTLVVAVLYARIWELVYQRQEMAIANEQLHSENLTTRYNMLVSQINPHFLFNSLNSLSMLVRERQEERALQYIERLSYTFRYIIQNGQHTLTTLGDELRFVEAYRYLFEVRYADKLFFDIEVDKRFEGWLLPALSLQPLIENAVKHNSITRAKPFRISIRTEGAWLAVSNPILPKLEAEQSTGIGLKNLSSRWKLIAGRDVVIERTQSAFTVRLPLLPPRNTESKP